MSLIDQLCMGCMREKNSDGKCEYCRFDEHTNSPAAHHLPMRTILSGKYLVGRVLGEGGFGITYLGWDLNLDLKVAIKEYFPMGFVTREITRTTNAVIPYVGDKEAFFAKGRARFVEEAKSLAKFFSLPGIVSVKDFFMENGTAYIVMEFVEGETLKQLLTRSGGKLPAGQVFEMMKPLLRSLSEIHKAGIIHRDISPDNIMVSKEGYVKLLDFGAARSFEDSDNKSLSVLLKPGYAPPEQYYSRGIQGPWTDVYALGATLYRMLTGLTPIESMERLVQDSLTNVKAAVPSISDNAANSVMRALSLKAQDRFQTVEMMYAQIYTSNGESIHPQAAVEKRIDTPERAPERLTVGLSMPNRGNTVGNIVNTGFAVHCYDTIFIINEKAICRINADGSMKSKINPDKGRYMNLESSWLYYSNASDGNKIYRMRIDGIRRSKICDDNSSYLNVVDGKIYYSNAGDSNKIYRINTDGSGRTKINDHKSFYLNAVDGWIYYSNASDSNAIYKVDTNGKAITKLNEDECFDANVVDGRIFYSNWSDSHCIYGMRVDGSERTKLNRVNSSAINATKDWIYFNDNDSKSICRMRHDGSELTTIANDWCINLAVIGDLIYYTNAEANGMQLISMRTDGTNRQWIGYFDR